MIDVKGYGRPVGSTMAVVFRLLGTYSFSFVMFFPGNRTIDYLLPVKSNPGLDTDYSFVV